MASHTSTRYQAIVLISILSVSLLVCLANTYTASASGIGDYLSTAVATDLLPDADRLGEPVGEPPLVPAYKDDQTVGYVYLNTDFTTSIGYSGKPIRILVGIDKSGVVRGLKLVEHKEPIVLIGIPEAKVIAALNGFIGRDMGRVGHGTAAPGRHRVGRNGSPTLWLFRCTIPT